MKVLTVSTQFPTWHPRAGQPTWFVESIMACLAETTEWEMPKEFMNYEPKVYLDIFPKFHTCRPGKTWKDGDWASLRIWSGKPYRSPQIEFAQVKLAVAPITIKDGIVSEDGREVDLDYFARHDGLSPEDFMAWFKKPFEGKVLRWVEAKTID